MKPEHDRQNRIDRVFRANHRGLICYIPLGDPLITTKLPRIYTDNGVDILEVGIPTRNPYLDGAVVSQSIYRACESGTTTAEITNELIRIRSTSLDAAVACFCYPDTELSALQNWTRASLMDGFMMADLDKRIDRKRIKCTLDTARVHQLSFVSFEVTEHEINQARKAAGYVMLQAFPGKTGVRDEMPDASIGSKIDNLRRGGITVPIVVGVGLSKPDQIRRAVDMGADGVVIGSACVRAAIEGEQAVAKFIKQVRSAVD